MTDLARLLAARIAQTGPMTLADYMAECLLHPRFGYYSTAEPFGEAGDFTTAPEISQMFGELIGLSLAQCWIDQGRPHGTLAELGPGRGTLMADVLRATRNIPGFHAAMDIVLMEASPKLRAQQRKTLGTAKVSWIDQIDQLPDTPLFLIANEFFDALPIRQFTKDGTAWRETVVGLADGKLVPGATVAAPIAALEHRLFDVPQGGVVEICPAAIPIAATIGRQISTHGGAALIFDYGGWRSLGDTFQAMAAHAYADPFAAPGTADLTAHVDFEALAQAARPALSSFATQGAVLEQLGISIRAEALARKLSGPALQSHQAALRRLTDPAEMGSLFKGLALYHPSTAPPPGFA